MSLSQLKQLVKDNGIKKTSHLNKDEIASLLTERGIKIPTKEPRQRHAKQPPVEATAPVRDHSRLRTIRNNPRRVRLTDVNTGEVREFQSLYSAGKFLGHSSKICHDYAGKVYKEKYRVEILTEESENEDIDDRGNEEIKS